MSRSLLGGAAMVLVLLCLGAEQASAEGIPVEVASKTAKAAAKRDFRAAIAAMDSEKFEQALRLFQASYAKVESPNSRLMIARMLVRLERFSEAYHELNGVISSATALAKGKTKYEKTVAAAHAEQEELKAKVAIVHLELDGVVAINGQDLPRNKWSTPVVLAPGETKFSYTLQNGQIAARQLELKAGQSKTISLKVARPETPTVSTRNVPLTDEDRGISTKTLGLVSGGIGIVGLVSFTVFGLMNQSKFSSLEQNCTGTLCPESSRANAETGRDLQTMANVGLGVGIAGAIGSAVFFLAGERTSGTDTPMQMGLGLGNVKVRGSF